MQDDTQLTNAGPITVLLVDEQPLVREGVRSLLARDGFDIVGEATTMAEALHLAARHRPDLIVVDPGLGNTAGATCSQLRQLAGAGAVVVLSARSDARTVRSCLEQGVRGYVVKSPGERPDLAALLRRALTGETILDAHASAALLPGGGSGFLLSDRERDVLGLVAEGMTNVEIGARLFLSRHTVKEYLSGAMRKLAVTNRVEAALEAARRGLIDATVATPEQARWILAAPAGRLEIVGSITSSMDDHELRLTPVKVRATTRA